MTLAVTTRREPYPTIVRRRLERTRHRPVIEQTVDTHVSAEKQQVAELPEEGLIRELFFKTDKPAQSSVSGLKEAQMLHPTLALAIATAHIEGPTARGCP
jgi:hypothetical protein